MLRRRPVCRACRLTHRPTHRLSSTKPPSSTLSQKVAEYIDLLQFRAITANQRLNDITGYSSIESLKAQIQSQENLARAARQAVNHAKHAYSAAVTKRAETQRELTNLLNRKTTWSPDDLSRFTTLYPTDHENEALVLRTQSELSLRERESEETSAELGRLILSRYHEEQVWSDKIRRASTWGTFGLMGINVLLFVVVQVGLEPWRRKRLVRGFEDKVKEVVSEVYEEKAEEFSENRPEDAISQPETEATAPAAMTEEENVEVEGVKEPSPVDSLHQRQDVWIGVASGAILGSLCTALGTWLISR